MTYSGIFPSSAEVPEVLYPILCKHLLIVATILCLLLYFSLFSHSLQKIIEQLYYTAAHFDHTERSVIYFFLVNFPSLVLGISSIVHNRSLTGL